MLAFTFHMAKFAEVEVIVVVAAEALEVVEDLAVTEEDLAVAVAALEAGAVAGATEEVSAVVVVGDAVRLVEVVVGLVEDSKAPNKQ